MVFGELEPKTYPPRTKGLKFSTKYPWGERNLLLEPPICCRTHTVPPTWSPKLGCRGTKGIQIHNQVALGRTGLGKYNQSGPGKKGLGCLGETWFFTKRTGWDAPWRLGSREGDYAPTKLPLRPRQGATFFPSFALSGGKKKKVQKMIKPYTSGLNRRF
jgi:hypothetical protein